MAMYELLIMDDEGNKVCSIGQFRTEEELVKWGIENKGEIDNC